MPVVTSLLISNPFTPSPVEPHSSEVHTAAPGHDHKTDSRHIDLCPPLMNQYKNSPFGQNKTSGKINLLDTIRPPNIYHFDVERHLTMRCGGGYHEIVLFMGRSRGHHVPHKPAVGVKIVYILLVSRQDRLCNLNNLCVTFARYHSSRGVSSSHDQGKVRQSLSQHLCYLSCCCPADFMADAKTRQNMSSRPAKKPLIGAFRTFPTCWPPAAATGQVPLLYNCNAEVIR